MKYRKVCKKSGLKQIFDDRNDTILENLDAAEYMNEYYVNAVPNLAKDFDDNLCENDCKISSDNLFCFKFVTEDQVRKLVKNIHISKSSAIENLSSRIIKDSFEVLTLELTQLYNECLKQFP